MSDLYNELINELEKCDIFVRYSTIEPKIILDLSGHDKPFKVKIRELKESYQKNIREIRTLEKEVVNYKQAFEDKCADYDVTSELVGKYQRENESLKQIVIELENFSFQAEQETESLVEKLKQRIAGLEKELEEWKEEARAVKKNRDEQLKSFRKAVEPYVDIGHMHETIEELKQRIAELESMKMENFSEIDTSNPLACAESLIEHMTHCEKFMIMPERDVQTFSVEELKEIADYLMVYYKHHKYRDEEDTISF